MVGKIYAIECGRCGWYRDILEGEDPEEIKKAHKCARKFTKKEIKELYNHGESLNYSQKN